jgi:hypothetical protein
MGMMKGPPDIHVTISPESHLFPSFSDIYLLSRPHFLS